MLPNSETAQKAYIEALEKEWKIQKHLVAERPIHSIYFGGGTPSLLHPDALHEILSWISFDPSIEITIEANPEELTKEKLHAFRSVGINRISIGAQSFDDTLLAALGRTHTASDTIKAVEEAEKQGFANITIDLMYDIPLQSLSAWNETLLAASKLPLSHLSLYNLQIEEGTLFHKKRNEIAPKMPDPDTSLAMLLAAQEALGKAGLMQYEISAFAKDGKYSRHNTSYWMAREFLGYGPSAFSYMDNMRFRNPAHFGKYTKALEENKPATDFWDTLEPQDRRKELLAIELRLLQGVDLHHFQVRHGLLEQETFNALQVLEEDGLIKDLRSRPKLTQKGLLFYDSVASALI